MESDTLFHVYKHGYGFGTAFDPHRYESIQNACNRLRARIQSGNTLVRVEVKRIKD